ncbi:type II toxin-antitoxin system VapC family toxin [Sphingomonas sp.]|uniref:type II toxin-antitoxin system VapC family toxin n=1 Tax=Sphingomonas sp. TaxID=28214 RepID=UPI00333E728E
MIVVDASLAVKWFLTEPDSNLALDLLERAEPDLCGPHFLGQEVCRALVAAANARRVEAVTARSAIRVWLARIESGQMPLHPVDWRMVQRATNIAIDLGHPLADCIYLALAIELDCELATCDAKFQAKASAVYPRVRLLSDFN